ncbi:xanthine dehydrogenase family protein molybdopterin-binding subunit [Chromohalobacter israelensis]|uniref:xanthine dehydrogenase family protein molybdopterin-binding subunit n=1 Tax=Chromohalobacter israelensis TaxID=141390 RepID=UPI000FFF31BF|nr:xanthine dehydrogenase family protein molybdopterin-binding subunit [Chromohalobacter salexigens]RXE47054.1 aldehyde oxidase [Chromohalobacter salexigens]
MTDTVIGYRTTRIDGELKLTGKADYAADHNLPGQVYGYPVPSTIARGRLMNLDLDAARQAPGVIEIVHRGNFPPLQHSDNNPACGSEGKLYHSPNTMAEQNKVGEARLPFEDDGIHYEGQYIAMVIADTFEHARAAARLVKAQYEKETAVPGLFQTDDEGEEAESEAVSRGDPAGAYDAAAVKFDHTYTIAMETHVAMELHASNATWDGDRLTIYESTQGVVFQRNALAQIFGIPPEKVTVIAHYIGSGFGSKLFMWPHAVITAVAAKMVGRPVKTVLSRQQNFCSAGNRPASRQRIRMAADRDGTLKSIRHDSQNETSFVDTYVESVGSGTPSVYACDNVSVSQRLVEVNHGTPTSMRAPGEASGSVALEIAIDEMANELGMDPLAFRRKNYPDHDPAASLPWSSNHLRDCWDDGARRFGWEKRNSEIGSMRDGHEVIGWGMANATWEAMRSHCKARVELRADGRVQVACGTQDIGTGTYTIVAQTASELTGIPIERIEVKLGDSTLPAGPLSGGSMATATVLPAVAGATRDAIEQLKQLAITDGAPFEGKEAGALTFENGTLSDGSQMFPFAELLDKLQRGMAEGEASAAPGDEQERYSFRSFGAHFVEVRWDPGISRLYVSRVVSTIDIGRAINPLTARNQVEGAIVMGIGMGMFEKTEFDASGNIYNNNYADYIVPVHADMPDVEVELLDNPDFNFNEFGARGIGEIGTTGMAAAISNAVYHATGKRIRELPITLDKLMDDVPQAQSA